MKGQLLTVASLVGLGVALIFESVVPTPCNPSNEAKCFARNKALSGELSEKFMNGIQSFKASTCPSGISTCHEGLKLTINKRFDNPSITSEFYILYGKVEAEIKASRGQGIISSFYLQSDDLDEIDIAEIFGGNSHEFQSNYFVRGNTSTYDRGGYHQLPPSPMDTYITYGMDWTPDKIVWTVNGNVIRVLDKGGPQGFPTSPMAIKFSLWAGGDPSNQPGTIDWAGGPTNYDDLPYAMYARNLKVSDYSTGSEYTYGNRAGRWSALTAHNGLIASQVEGVDLQAMNPNSDDVDSGSDYEIEYEYIYESDRDIYQPDKRFLQYPNNSKSTTNDSQLSSPILSLVKYLCIELLAMLIWF